MTVAARPRAGIRRAAGRSYRTPCRQHVWVDRRSPQFCPSPIHVRRPPRSPRARTPVFAQTSLPEAPSRRPAPLHAGVNPSRAGAWLPHQLRVDSNCSQPVEFHTLGEPRRNTATASPFACAASGHCRASAPSRSAIAMKGVLGELRILTSTNGLGAPARGRLPPRPRRCCERGAHRLAECQMRPSQHVRRAQLGQLRWRLVRSIARPPTRRRHSGTCPRRCTRVGRVS